jgi:hypothetical protein
VAPAAFDHPRMLELGVDVGATGLDKYGTIEPRFGLMAGEKALVGRIRAKAFECGLEARQMLYAAVVRTLEQYRPARVQQLIASTRRVAAALRPIYGARLHETPTTAQLLAEDLLAMAMERAGVKEPPVVPYEAAAAFCMLLLEEHRMLTVHFVGMPPGTRTSSTIGDFAVWDPGMSIAEAHHEEAGDLVRATRTGPPRHATFSPTHRVCVSPHARARDPRNGRMTALLGSSLILCMPHVSESGHSFAVPERVGNAGLLAKRSICHSWMVRSTKSCHSGQAPYGARPLSN